MTKFFVHIVVMLLVGLLCLPAAPSADQAQYFYDELGRVVGSATRGITSVTFAGRN